MIYAKWGKRFYAFTLDIIVIYLFVFLMLKIMNYQNAFRDFIYFSGVFGIFYFSILLILFHGRTIGAFIFGLRIVSPDGNRLVWYRAFVRAVLLTVFIVPDTLNILFLLLFIFETIRIRKLSPYKERNQTGLDFYSKTVVISAVRTENSTKKF